MKAMDKAFGFPPYFGKNWDALWECMRDLYWINDSEIQIKLSNFTSVTGKLKPQITRFFEDLVNQPNNSNKQFRLESVP